MPEMDGIEVVKAAKHLRPDLDILMITGYATIESAVEAMKHGATDYVQKPFTADELVAFVDQTLIRRDDRLQRAMRPHVRLVTASHAASKSTREYNVPAGLFVSPGHAWVGMYANGLLLMGMDDFAQKVFGPVEDVVLPEPGQEVAAGDPLFDVVRGDHRLSILAPASGKVVAVNEELEQHPNLMNVKPYETGWVCWLEPSNLPAELPGLRVGADALAWYETEIDRHLEVLRELGVDEVPNPPHDGVGAAEAKDEAEHAVWDAIERTLGPR
jgi:glycine cleavage system H lipoate-binding protein